jgi:hypothetical protein
MADMGLPVDIINRGRDVKRFGHFKPRNLTVKTPRCQRGKSNPLY